jgi:hypothetical protein
MRRARARSLCSTSAGFIWPPAAQSGREHKCVWLVASAIHGAQHKTLAKTRLSLRFISQQQQREKRKKLPSSLSCSLVFASFVREKSTFSTTFVV